MLLEATWQDSMSVRDVANDAFSFGRKTMLNSKPNEDEPKLWLTTRQVASMLQISERTLYEITKDGALPRVRLGARGQRFRRADVEKFAAEFGTAA